MWQECLYSTVLFPIQHLYLAVNQVKHALKSELSLPFYKHQRHGGKQSAQYLKVFLLLLPGKKPPQHHWGLSAGRSLVSGAICFHTSTIKSTIMNGPISSVPTDAEIDRKRIKYFLTTLFSPSGQSKVKVTPYTSSGLHWQSRCLKQQPDIDVSPQFSSAKLPENFRDVSNIARHIIYYR